MTDTTVIYTRKDHVARITLNRPDADNVIDLQLAQELASTCAAVNQDDDIHVAVITGAGDKVFCGGSEPAISYGRKYKDETLTGWTKSLDEGDVLAFNVDSCATITRVTITLGINKT